MLIKIQVVIETSGEDGLEPVIEEIARVERADLKIETLGLSLAEAKEIVANIQKAVTSQQVVEHLEQHRHCPHCDSKYLQKGSHRLVFRTLFGKLKLTSPRLLECECQKGLGKSKSFSPLTAVLAERTAPEFLYLQSKWSALMSYGLSAKLLEEVLPLEKSISTATLIQSVVKVVERGEKELGPEQASFIEGCPAEWGALPAPDAPPEVGIDGGYVHGREGKNRKAGSFEVIVGKNIPIPTDTGKNTPKCFGFVNNYDPKPRRRLYELLHSQGMQYNQEVTFLSDGGDTVRAIQFYLNPQAAFILDWFHVAMRLTVLGQFIKGLPIELLAPAPPVPTPLTLSKTEAAAGKPKTAQVNDAEEEAEEEIKYPTATELQKELERVKWYLWHGNAYKALKVLGDLNFELEVSELEVAKKSLTYRKVLKAIRAFTGYIRSNQAYVVNYGDKYRNGERSSSLAESTVNQVISKRFVKKQQQLWTKKGVHLLLQVRTKVLNEELGATFQRWYPGLKLQTEINSPKEKKVA